MLQAEKNHTDSLQVRDKAVARQVTKQPDNSIGMTCFDRAMGISSRLGQIFSDTYPTTDFAAASTKVFGTLYDGGSGSGKTLGDSFNTVVSGMMESHADDFGDSLSSWLGATAMQFLSGYMTPITGFVNSINGLISTINGTISAIDSAMGTLGTIMDLLGTVIPTIIPTTVNAIAAAWKTIKTTMTQAVQAVQKLIRDVVKQITDFVMGAAQNLFGNDATSDEKTGECERIQRLWNPGVQDKIGDFRSVVGSGLEQGTPYLTFSNMLSQTSSGLGSDMLHEIGLPANSAVLNAALSDISAGGALAAPGKLPSWPTVPTFTPNASIANIRSLMN
ncbi:MAG: hypothetical protein PW788_11375 [Micavibrio sp.]|nr:hypothetical protein [Micavibrio sp.]